MHESEKSDKARFVLSRTFEAALTTGRCLSVSSPGGKAKAFKAGRHARQRHGLRRIRGNRSRPGMLIPSLKAQGEQRRPSLFNIPRNNPLRKVRSDH